MHTKNRAQRFVTIGYIAVDAFLLLTGFLFGLQAVKRSWSERQLVRKENAKSNVSTCESDQRDYCCSRHRMGWYRRFVRIMPPMMLAIAMHCLLLFPNGLYPLGAVRSEARVDLQRFAADPFSPGVPPSEDALQDASYGMCNNGCGSWWANLFQLQALVPFGGAMIHTWTIVTQYLFYLTFPLVTRNIDLSNKARMPLFCAAVLACSAVFKLVGFVHVSGMAHNSIVRGVLSFFWYAFPAARVGVVYAGVALAWLLHAWESGSRPKVQAALDWALGPTPAALMFRSAAWGLLATYVHFADADFGASQSALLSTLLHVGSIGSALSWSWLLVLAVTGTPILGAEFEQMPILANGSVSMNASLSPLSQKTPPVNRPRLRSRSVSDLLQLPARGLSAAEPADDTAAKEAAGAALPVSGKGGGDKASQGGVSLLTTALAWRGFQPLARLSYLTYLVHCMVMVFAFSQPSLLMPHSVMPLPVPRPMLKQNTVTAASIGFWINGTWPRHGKHAEHGADAWLHLDHDAIARKWATAHTATARAVLPSKNAEQEQQSGHQHTLTPPSSQSEAPPGCWAQSHAQARALGLPSAFEAVGAFTAEVEYPHWATRQQGTRAPTPVEFWAATLAVIAATFAVCWGLDLVLVSPATRLLLSAPVANLLQWPVLAYSVGVLVVGVLGHSALAGWYLTQATPWMELGGAGVLHVPPQSPLVRAYHAYHFQQVLPA